MSIQNEASAFSEIENVFKNCIAGFPDTTFDKVLLTEFKGTGVSADLNYSVMIDKKIETRHQIISKLITDLKAKNISFTGV